MNGNLNGIKQEVKRIDIKEFREMGLLTEVNRTFFHPLGLALEVVVNDDGSESIGGIWDYREDPEGMTYHILNIEKMNKAKEFIEQKHKIRKEKLGFIFQEK